MQGKDLVLVGALGGLGFIIYKWWENVKSTAPVSVQQTTNATGQTTASVNVGGSAATPTYYCSSMFAPQGCVTTSTGVVLPIHVPRGVGRPAIMLPSSYTFNAGDIPGVMVAETAPSLKGPFATGVSGRRGPSGLGSISPSLGFGIRRAANIFPLGIERRIIY